MRSIFKWYVLLDRSLTPHVEEPMVIWYRHSGEPKLVRSPPLSQITFKTISDESQITADIGNHYITHMYIKNGVLPPSLSTIAPKLSRLLLWSVTDTSQLDR